MKKFNTLLVVHTIDGFAGSLIGVFVPLYLYQIGYSLSWIAVCLILSSIFNFFSFLLAGYLVKRIGLKNIFQVRLPFLFIYLLFVYFLDGLPPAPYIIFLLAALRAIPVAFYWFPLHYYFVVHHDESSTGKEVGKLMAVPRILTLAAPLIGGTIATLYGFKALFAVSILVYLITIIPVTRLHDIKERVELDLPKIKNYFTKYPKYLFALLFDGAGSELEGVVLPIFLFLAAANLVSVGALSLFAGVGGILFTFLIGHYSDSANKRSLMKVGAIVLALIWLVRFFLDGQIMFFITSLIAGFAAIMISVPFNAIGYQAAKNDQTGEFIIFRELPMALGRSATYLAMMLAVAHLKTSFLIGVISYLYFLMF